MPRPSVSWIASQRTRVSLGTALESSGVSSTSNVMGDAMSGIPMLNWETAARITRQRAGIHQPNVKTPGSPSNTVIASSRANAIKLGSGTHETTVREGLKTTKSSPRNRFHRERLPVAKLYYEKEGLKLIGRSEWRSALCPFHDDKKPAFAFTSGVARSGAWRAVKKVGTSLPSR
jgi:hypothetical protein